MSGAAAAYHDLLEEAGMVESSLEALQEGQRERRLVFGERPLSVSLRPQLLEREQYRHAVAASQALYSALASLERALLAEPGLRRELDLEPEEERLALADPGARASSASARLDGFLEGRIRYVEYNAESPAGMAYSDHLIEVFRRLPLMRAFQRRYRLRALPVRRRQLECMLRSFREWSRGRHAPVVAIVDWTGLPTTTEFEMFRDHFEAAGIPTVICDPRQIEFRQGRMYADGRAVNLVYRRVLTSELLARGREAGALAEAYLAGAVCVVNSFRAKLLHKKMSLALLSDERYASLYTPAQRRAIAEHVPWTRKVRPELAEIIARQRRRLVLKPNDEYGGKGVTLGWTVSQAEWESALEGALAEPSVVQERVPLPSQRFPVDTGDGGVQLMDLTMDLDPYLFHGRVGGCLTRLSSSALLNVTAGAGSVVPTFVVEGQR